MPFSKNKLFSIILVVLNVAKVYKEVMIQRFPTKKIRSYRPKDIIRFFMGFLKSELFNDSDFKKPMKNLKHYYCQQLKVLRDKSKNVKIVILTMTTNHNYVSLFLRNLLLNNRSISQRNLNHLKLLSFYLPILL